MQEPGCSMGPSPSPMPPRRRRQKRTVYSIEQRQALEEAFGRSRYPTYQEREALAERLNLQEHQVQVWFKNRRAKYSRQLGHSRRQGPQVRSAPQDPQAWAPAPASAPAPVGPVCPGGPVFPEGPGFCSAPPPSPFGVLPAAGPNVSSYNQAWWDPGQGVQKMVPAAPAPVPAPASAPAPAPDAVWPQGLYASDFSPETVEIHDFIELPSLQDLLEEPSSPSISVYQESDDCVDDKYLGPRTLLDL